MYVKYGVEIEMINDDVTDVSTGVLVIGETTGVVVITAMTSAIIEMILSNGDLAHPLSYPFSAIISHLSGYLLNNECKLFF